MKERQVSVLVTVDDTHYKFETVAEKLQSAGLQQTDLMPFSGIVGGVVSPQNVEKLKQVEGVQAVELQGSSHAY